MPKLWRFYVRTEEGDRDETCAIVFAKNADDAVRRGFEILEERELLAQTQEAYHVPPPHEDDEEGGFFTCSEITSADELEAALDGIVALVDLSRFTAGIAELTWPVLERRDV